MKEFISIIIPVYNREKCISRAVNSVLKQSYKNFELIVIDDCSTDNTIKAINNIKDERIICINNKKNMGISYSRNIGIKNSTYDLIALLDSDDEWLPAKLEKQMEFLNINPEYNLIHTEEIWIKNGKKINQKKKHKKNGGDIFIPSLNLCLISPSSVLIRKQVFNKYGMFDESMPVCEDYDMWLRITANEEVGFINQQLTVKYGGHDDQLSAKYHSMDKYRVLAMINILEKYHLNNEKENAVKKMIVKKSIILLNGAKKRMKKEKINKYQSWINRYK